LRVPDAFPALRVSDAEGATATQLKGSAQSNDVFPAEWRKWQEDLYDPNYR